MKHQPFILLFIVAISTLWVSCTKEDFLQTGGSVYFSSDTVAFDTVWTSQKTSTIVLKLYNRENQKIKTDIFLANGSSSPFDINVNGIAGKQVPSVEIAARDSAYIFVTMKADPTDEDAPFILEDMLVAKLNGNEFKIPIIAYGQNAYYINDSVLTTTTLLTDKPYVIINSALVADGHTLTVPAGARIYMHRNSRLFVSGTLRVQGTLNQPVTIQGDRIDRKIYEGDTIGAPGEWGGIYFTSTSVDNVINYAIIKNGGLSTQVNGQGTIAALIQVDKGSVNSTTPKLTITNSKVWNGIQYGLVAFETHIYAENCVIGECQGEALLLLQGGRYTFNDCTIGNWGGTRFNKRLPNSTSVVIQNYYNTSPTTFVGSDLFARFNNSIVYGSQENELILTKKGDYAYDAVFDHCLIRSVESLPSFATYTANLLNQPPTYSDIRNLDYTVKAGSPAINAGINAGMYNMDINGVVRTATPTIGAYEYTD